MPLLYNDLRRRIISAIEHPFTDKRTDKSLLIALHGEVFNSNLCRTCENEQIYAYITLTRLSQNDFKMAKPSKYTFITGVKISIPSLSRTPITKDNLTDAQAKVLIELGYVDLIVEVEKSEPKPKKSAKTKA